MKHNNQGNGLISQDLIDQARMAPIADLIGQEYPLVRDGGHWMRVDPKHTEAHSLTLNTQSNRFTWWQKDEKGGDTICWMMKYSRLAPLTFPEAIAHLLNMTPRAFHRETHGTYENSQKSVGHAEQPIRLDPVLARMYHHNLQDEGYAWWRKRGVPAHIVDALWLGEDKNSYTIPVWSVDHYGQALRNIRHRNKAADGSPRYWQERSGLGTQLYVPQPGALAAEYVVLVAGEIKAIVLGCRGIMAISTTAGCTTWQPEWTHYLYGKKVVIAFDPGEEEAAERITRQIADQTQMGIVPFIVTNLPMAPDDMLVKMKLPVDSVRRALGLAPAAPILNYYTRT